MNNVSFVIPGLCDRSFWKEPRTLELFTGTERFRNVMRIRFMASPNGRKYLTLSPLYDVMMNLGGFRKLVVEFESRGNPGPEKTRLTSEQAQAVSQSECEEFKDHHLKYIFGRAYGPAMQGTLHHACNYTCYLEFYPRQHFARELIAKAGKTLEEAARLAKGEHAEDSLIKFIEKLKLL